MDDLQSEVVAFLRDPTSYPDDAGPIELFETHISLVFLAGKYAYKLKQAVKYPYLDFSTVELRQAACRAELALNRRTAPQLYLEVRAIIRSSSGQLCWGGASNNAYEAVDFVVVMRRFDQRNLLDNMAERDELSPALLHALTAHIVQFHEKAEKRPGHGGAAAMKDLAQTSLALLRACRSAIVLAPRIDRIERGLNRELNRVGSLLDSRDRSGKVRWCHGDLHLRNSCLIDGKPVLFDCIEFSEDIATIDVLYDLSFLLMDLDHRGRRGCANLVLNRYLDLSGDDDGLVAIPLFVAVRALIRSHIAATMAEHSWGGDNASGAPADVRSYVDEAEAALNVRQPVLIAIGGLSGTGKSTLSARLAPEFGRCPGARLLRSDVLRKIISGSEPENPLPAEAYAWDVTQRVYDGLCAKASMALAAGYFAVIDAVASREEQRRTFEAVAEKSGVPFIGIWLEASPEHMISRVTARTLDASDASPGIVRQQLGQNPGVLSWTRVDANGDPTATFLEARRAITEMIGT